MKRVLRNIAIGCSIVFATIELACAQSTSSHLKDKFVYNFGTISEDTTIVYGHLDYTNTCNDNLIITRLIPSCSCVEAQATDTVIKPGQKCRINFSFKPLNYPGHIDKQIYIYTNQDQNTSTETLYLTGVVTPTTNPIHEYRFS